MTRWLACQKDNELGKTMATPLTWSTLTRVSSWVTKLYFHLGSCYSASVDTFMNVLFITSPPFTIRACLRNFQPPAPKPTFDFFFNLTVFTNRRMTFDLVFNNTTCDETTSPLRLLFFDEQHSSTKSTAVNVHEFDRLKNIFKKTRTFLRLYVHCSSLGICD